MALPSWQLNGFNTPFEIDIADETHAFLASYNGRLLADTIGFTNVEKTALSTAILEVTRNVVKYADRGSIQLQVVYDTQQNTGIQVTISDTGPGISDIELAMQDGYSTGKSLGLGLPGARRLMSTFDIQSEAGKGTIICMTKWKKS